jgi:hypothetical protein
MTWALKACDLTAMGWDDTNRARSGDYVVIMGHGAKDRLVDQVETHSPRCMMAIQANGSRITQTRTRAES